MNNESLHRAVLHGNVPLIRTLIEQQVDCNAEDPNGNTPILLAGCIKDETVYNNVLGILIENGANANSCNKGITPLYNAAFHQRAESVEMLLRRGAWFASDDTLRIVLHLLVENDNKNILRMILDDSRCGNGMLNCMDGNGMSLAYKAAYYRHKDCLKLLMEKGCDLTKGTDLDGSVFDAIFENFTRPVDFIIRIFDSKISMDKIEGKNRYFVENVDGARMRQMDVISSLIGAASDEEKFQILQHPFVELFLVLKWAKICHFFYLWLTIYSIFVSSMTVYITLFLHKNQKFLLIQIIARCILILSATGLLAHAILQCLLTNYRNYLRKYEMWMNVASTSLCLAVAIAADQDISNMNEMSNWLLNIVSIAVLLAWIELMLLIGRLPTYGYYALMFATVLQNVIKVLLAFMCLVIGFALSFSIQFHNYDQFVDPWRALVKTTVMMMGEFEYADLFADKADNDLPAISRVVFLMFIILTSIVLMNLMVGLAVSDIQGLQLESCARKLEKQAEFLGQFEKVICSKQLNSKWMPGFLRQIFYRKSFIERKCELNTSAKFRRSKKVPTRVIDSIVAIAKADSKIN